MLSKSEIANKLKQLREKNGLSVKEVIQKLSSNGIKISLKTLYAWESGRNQPDADTFMVLCDIYEVKNVMDTFGYKKCPSPAASIPPEFPNEEKRLLLHFRSLNSEGRQKLLSYSDDLISSGNYVATKENAE